MSEMVVFDMSLSAFVVGVTFNCCLQDTYVIYKALFQK